MNKHVLQQVVFSVWVLFSSNSFGDVKMEYIPPSIIPISLKTSGNIVDTKILIIDHHVYHFNLRFSYTESDLADRARVRALTGSHERFPNGEAVNQGVPIPVRLSIFATENKQETHIFSREVSPILTSDGGSFFRKEIGLMKLKPGKYRVKLDLLVAATPFEGTPAFLDIYYNKYKETVN